MRLEEISVRGLLRQFNYRIPLHADNRVTIVAGPNGYGKTTLLKLIDSFYRGQYDALRDTPFDVLELAFAGGVRLVISRQLPLEEPIEGGPTHPQITCALYAGNTLLHQDEVKGGHLRMPKEPLHHYLPFIEPGGPDIWLDNRSGEVIRSADVLVRYGDFLPPRARGVLRRSAEPSWLKEHKEQFRVRFIQSQRLLLEAGDSRIGPDRHSSDTSRYQYTVNAYARELSQTINFKIAEYGALTASYERTFPSRFVAQDDILGDRADTLKASIKARLDAIEKKRGNLQASGLLDKQVDDRLTMMANFSDAKLVFLDLYTQDVETKLQLFDDLAARIGLFTDILNNKFSYKTLSISRERGFVITVDGLGDLPPQGLSSGEQHELVLCFELLFKTGSGYLVMIDEPEISLHVEWQESFLDDLEKMADLAKFDSLIATHSPIVVGNRWDLAVNLSHQIHPVPV